LARLADVVTQATAAFEEFDYARAQEFAETFFWSFCDDYVELVKTRAYGGGDASADSAAAPSAGADSARATLALALSVQLRLFAPFLPFVTEEVWRWWQPGSVHRAAWPTAGELEGAAGGDSSVLQVAAEVLGAIRRAKTTEKRSMRAKVRQLTVSGPPDVLVAVEAAREDLTDAGGVEELVLEDADVLSVSVVLAEET
jgi:valyl-tRNA synthetase